jgi:aminopeptidase
VADIRIEKMADLLVNYSVAVRAGDKVAIMGEAPAEPLLKAIYV